MPEQKVSLEELFPDVFQAAKKKEDEEKTPPSKARLGAGSVIRLVGGVAGAEGGAPGAAIGAGTEGLAELVEGGGFNPLNWKTKDLNWKRMTAEGGISAVPLAKIFKAGRPLASAIKGAVFNEAGNIGRRAATEGVKEALPNTKEKLLGDALTSTIGAGFGYAYGKSGLKFPGHPDHANVPPNAPAQPARDPVTTVQGFRDALAKQNGLLTDEQVAALAKELPNTPHAQRDKSAMRTPETDSLHDVVGDYNKTQKTKGGHTLDQRQEMLEKKDMLDAIKSGNPDAAMQAKIDEELRNYPKGVVANAVGYKPANNTLVAKAKGQATGEKLVQDEAAKSLKAEDDAAREAERTRIAEERRAAQERKRLEQELNRQGDFIQGQEKAEADIRKKYDRNETAKKKQAVDAARAEEFARTQRARQEKEAATVQQKVLDDQASAAAAAKAKEGKVAQPSTVTEQERLRDGNKTTTVTTRHIEPKPDDGDAGGGGGSTPKPRADAPPEYVNPVTGEVITYYLDKETARRAARKLGGSSVTPDASGQGWNINFGSAGPPKASALPDAKTRAVRLMQNNPNLTMEQAQKRIADFDAKQAGTPAAASTTTPPVPQTPTSQPTAAPAPVAQPTAKPVASKPKGEFSQAQEAQAAKTATEAEGRATAQGLSYKPLSKGQGGVIMEGGQVVGEVDAKGNITDAQGNRMGRATLGKNKAQNIKSITTTFGQARALDAEMGAATTPAQAPASAPTKDVLRATDKPAEPAAKPTKPAPPPSEPPAPAPVAKPAPKPVKPAPAAAKATPPIAPKAAEPVAATPTAKPTDAAPVVTKPAAAIPVAKAVKQAKTEADKVSKDIYEIDLTGARDGKEVQSRIEGVLQKELHGLARTPKIEVRGDIVVVDGEPAFKMDSRGHLVDESQAMTDAKGKTTGIVDLGEIQSKTPAAIKDEITKKAAAHLSEKAGQGNMTIKVPGDGTFTIRRNAEAIQEFMDRLKRGVKAYNPAKPVGSGPDYKTGSRTTTPNELFSDVVPKEGGATPPSGKAPRLTGAIKPDPELDALTDALHPNTEGAPKINPTGHGTMPAEPPAPTVKPKAKGKGKSTGKSQPSDGKQPETATAAPPASGLPVYKSRLEAAAQNYEGAKGDPNTNKLGVRQAGVALGHETRQAGLPTKGGGPGTLSTFLDKEISPKVAQNLDRPYTRNPGKGESGQIDPMLLTRLAGGGIGAALGATDEEDPLGAAIFGGLAGATAPSLFSKNKSGGVGLGNAVLAGAERAPNYLRSSMLSDPRNLLYNMWAGPWASGTLGGLERTMGGQQGGKELLRRQANVPGWLKDFFKAYPNIKNEISELERADYGRVSKRGPVDEVMEIPAALMTSGDHVTRGNIMSSGVPEQAAREMTLTNEPGRIFPIFKDIANFGKSRGPAGTLSTTAKALLPFRRTSANIAESALERTPGIGIGTELYKRWRIPQTAQGWRPVAAQQAIGTAVFTAAEQIGENVPDSVEKDWKIRNLVSNMGGQYAGVASLGYAYGKARRAGKVGEVTDVDSALKSAGQIGKDAFNNLPLPNLRIPQNALEILKGPNRMEKVGKSELTPALFKFFLDLQKRYQGDEQP